MKDVPGDKRSRRDGENNGMENVDLKRLKRHEVESLLFGDMTNYILSGGEFVRLQPEVCDGIAARTRGDYGDIISRYMKSINSGNGDISSFMDSIIGSNRGNTSSNNGSNSSSTSGSISCSSRTKPYAQVYLIKPKQDIPIKQGRGN